MSIEVEIEVSRSKLMSDEVYSRNGSIGVFDILVKTTDGTPFFVARNAWLNEVTDRESGEKFLSLKSTTYPDKRPNANINPKTEKPYDDIPFTFCPGVTDKGQYTFIPDKDSPLFKAICEKVYEAVEEEKSKNPQPVAQTTTSRAKKLL